MVARETAGSSSQTVPWSLPLATPSPGVLSIRDVTSSVAPVTQR